MPSVLRKLGSKKSSSFKLEDGLLVDEDIDRDLLQESNTELDVKDLTDWLPPPSEPSEPSTSASSISSAGSSYEPGCNSQSKQSLYGKFTSSKELKEIFKSDFEEQANAGLIWKATIVPDDFDVDYEKNKTLKMIPNGHYDAKNKCIKPRRGNLAVTETDFLSSLTHVQDLHGTGEASWVFSGVLCGWPGLKHLEVLKIEYKQPIVGWRTHWESEKDGANQPTYPKGGIIEVRAKLRAPSWTAFGWSRESPGYFYWYECARGNRDSRILYGSSITETFEKERIESGKPSPKCVKVHMVSHRYATGKKENAKDKITYHSLALLEWDHGEYMTVAEVGFLNGLSGYNGRSNWIEDKLEEVTSLFKCMPPEMVTPWREKLLEVRCLDVKAKCLDEFLQYMKKYTGIDKRFVDVQHTFSHDVRLSFNSREHIAQYLINYVRRDRSYSEMSRNCQTFVADFCAFLAGKRNVQPFHLVSRIEYRNHSYHFLYDGNYWR